MDGHGTQRFENEGTVPAREEQHGAHLLSAAFAGISAHPLTECAPNSPSSV